MNEKIFIVNKNNRRNYDELKYKVIEDENIDNVNLGGNEQILINDGNLIKNMKDKEQNDIDNEDFQKKKLVKILKKLNKYTKKLYFKMLIMINAIMMILMKEKLIEVTLKKLNSY